MMTLRYRPLVLVLTHDVYACDPLKFEGLALEARAKLVRIESEDVDFADLGAMLSAAAVQAREIRADEACPPSSGVPLATSCQTK